MAPRHDWREARGFEETRPVLERPTDRFRSMSMGVMHVHVPKMTDLNSLPGKLSADLFPTLVNCYGTFAAF